MACGFNKAERFSLLIRYIQKPKYWILITL